MLYNFINLSELLLAIFIDASFSLFSSDNISYIKLKYLNILSTQINFFFNKFSVFNKSNSSSMERIILFLKYFNSVIISSFLVLSFINSCNFVCPSCNRCGFFAKLYCEPTLIKLIKLFTTSLNFVTSSSVTSFLFFIFLTSFVNS